MFDWDNESVARENLEWNRTRLKPWFSELKMWEHDDDPPGKLMWVKLGVPIAAWNFNAIRNVASEVGKVIDMDVVDFESPDLSSIGVLVHTVYMETVNQIVFQAKISEDCNRSVILDLRQSSIRSSGEKDVAMFLRFCLQKRSPYLMF